MPANPEGPRQQSETAAPATIVDVMKWSEHLLGFLMQSVGGQSQAILEANRLTTLARRGIADPTAVDLKFAIMNDVACNAAYHHGRHEAAEQVAALSASVERLTRERDALAADLKTATTFDICGDWEISSHAEDSYDGLLDRFGEIKEVWTSRTLGQKWAAMVVTVPESDTNDEETGVAFFDTEAEAKAAVAASRALRAGSPRAEGERKPAIERCACSEGLGGWMHEDGCPAASLRLNANDEGERNG